MGNGDAGMCERVRGSLTNSGADYDESEVQYGTKFTMKVGAKRASLVVFNTGKLHVEGAESDAKAWLAALKASIETGSGAPGMLLPAEIERFPQTLRERVPDCDDVVLWYFQEALRCYKANSLLQGQQPRGRSVHAWCRQREGDPAVDRDLHVSDRGREEPHQLREPHKQQDDLGQVRRVQALLQVRESPADRR
jgi:hypothetical protein